MHCKIPVVDHQTSSASFVGRGKFADSFHVVVMHLLPTLFVSEHGSLQCWLQHEQEL